MSVVISFEKAIIRKTVRCDHDSTIHVTRLVTMRYKHQHKKDNRKTGQITQACFNINLGMITGKTGQNETFIY